MSVSLQALFYFLALVCFVGAAASFAPSRRRSGFVSRVNLLALGLAFWVLVPFVNALLRIR
jgi:hypothetical protein